MIGVKIKELRIDNELKLKDIANVLGVKISTYSSWERGENEMPLMKLNELANYYHTTFDYILGLSLEHEFIKEKKEIDLNILKTRLYEIRKQKNLSQNLLCQKIGFSQTTYSQYERGITIPTSFKLLAIAQYYNVSIDYLVGRKKTKKINSKVI